MDLVELRIPENVNVSDLVELKVRFKKVRRKRKQEQTEKRGCTEPKSTLVDEEDDVDDDEVDDFVELDEDNQSHESDEYAEDDEEADDEQYETEFPLFLYLEYIYFTLIYKIFMSDLCDSSERIFSSEPSVLQLRAPIKIFRDLHGQFGDLMRLLDEYGSPSTARETLHKRSFIHLEQSFTHTCLVNMSC
ncbi:BRI1 suppressor 1 (BSU1)-like 3 [Artemisia annua]|uniref:BRI1 suppressor 1 (BSU1)-like 3 n=1 Tax=Artemisia annua TaxID=35608 RepID=A0A2U1NFJ1_ARTAN|nr:BRI1 suppressor 1 (BSU1)-like 3 [Artemisia annua]